MLTLGYILHSIPLHALEHIVLKSKAEMLLESTTNDSCEEAPPQHHSGIAGRDETSSMQLSSSPRYAEFISHYLCTFMNPSFQIYFML